MHLELLSHCQVAVPTIGRLIAQPLLKESITHCYHRTVHAGIHLGFHKLHFVGHFLKKYPLAIDVVVILAMLAFDALTEHEGGHESHEVGALSELRLETLSSVAGCGQLGCVVFSSLASNSRRWSYLRYMNQRRVLDI
jgi:hypothetical protein